MRNAKGVLSTRLRLLRVMAGETQEQTAKSLNISRSCLANYETGRRVPDSHTLVLFAEHFRVNAAYLIGQSPLGTTDISDREKELIRLVPEGGLLDLSEITSEGKIALLQFYHFLQEKHERMQDAPSASNE